MISVNGHPGLYLVYDGIVGCGKTTQILRLKEVLPKNFPGINILFTYEPGGLPEAEKIRKKVKFEAMSPEEEVYWYLQSRAITLPKVVRPALDKGFIVISDRCVTTSIDYQGIGRKVGMDEVWRVNKDVVGKTLPDILILPRVGLEESLRRSGDDNTDKFDKEGEFMKACYDGYPLMVEFLKSISPATKVIEVDDPEGKLDVDQMAKAIEVKLYPMIDSWIREGKIVRERERVKGK